MSGTNHCRERRCENCGYLTYGRNRMGVCQLTEHSRRFSDGCEAWTPRGRDSGFTPGKLYFEYDPIEALADGARRRRPRKRGAQRHPLFDWIDGSQRPPAKDKGGHR